jgi:hypothetical protein
MKRGRQEMNSMRRKEISGDEAQHESTAAVGLKRLAGASQKRIIANQQSTGCSTSDCQPDLSCCFSRIPEQALSC